MPDILKAGNMEFKLSEVNSNLNDNICCDGQHISIQRDNVVSIMLLAFGGNGSFEDDIEIIYNDGTMEKIEAKFSDWYGQPDFSEEIGWEGNVEVRAKSDNSMYISPFIGKIFAKRYQLHSKKNIRYINLKGYIYLL